MYILGGTLKRQKIKVPKGKAVRPTASHVREAVFNTCQVSINGAKFLDLFAGSGAMGLEALSRGAVSSFFIENDKYAIRCIRENIERLGLTQSAKLISQNVQTALSGFAKQEKKFDIIWADPPYQQSVGPETLMALDTYDILAQDGMIMMEEKKGALDATCEKLQTLKLIKTKFFGSSSVYIFTTCASFPK